MTEASYHSETDTLSCSQLKVFCKSPRDYQEQFITGLMPKKQRTSAMDLGTICHAVLLERKSIDDVCRQYPTTALNVKGGINPGPAAAFALKIMPLIAVKEETYDQAVKICESAMKSELGDILRSGADFEQRITAKVDDVDCRAKPDIHSIIDGTCLIYDLKITERIYPDDFWRTAKQMQYFIQSAHYVRTAKAKYECPAMLRFWALESTYPYRIRPYWYEPRGQEIAEEFHAKKLAHFAECKATGVWADRWESTGTIGPWDINANDDGEMVEWEG